MEQRVSADRRPLGDDWEANASACGNNIQKGVAISQIKRKVFAIFAIQYGGVEGQTAKLEIRPEKIRAILPEHEDIFVLPYYDEPVTLDFGNREKLQTATETINKMVAEVELEDPWVKETFNIEGVGEGLVLYPETDDLVFREGYTELIFKAKGEKHRVVRGQCPLVVEDDDLSRMALQQAGSSNRS